MKEPIDQLIFAALASNSTSRDACPDESILRQYCDSRLPRSETDRVEMHLTKCSICRRAIIFLSRILNGPTKKEQSVVTGQEHIGDFNLECDIKTLKEKFGIPEENRDRQNLPTIMIVDDDRDYLNSLVDALEQNYLVTACSSGQEALKKIHEDVKAVVLDIKMPGMDGLAVARILKKSHSNIPILFNTGYPGEYKKDHIEGEFRHCHYVTKDNSPDLLSSLRSMV